jgi:hypothetical protein
MLALLLLCSDHWHTHLLQVQGRHLQPQYVCMQAGALQPSEAGLAAPMDPLLSSWQPYVALAAVAAQVGTLALGSGHFLFSSAAVHVIPAPPVIRASLSSSVLCMATPQVAAQAASCFGCL